MMNLVLSKGDIEDKIDVISDTFVKEIKSIPEYTFIALVYFLSFSKTKRVKILFFNSDICPFQL